MRLNVPVLVVELPNRVTYTLPSSPVTKPTGIVLCSRGIVIS